MLRNALPKLRNTFHAAESLNNASLVHISMAEDSFGAFAIEPVAAAAYTISKGAALRRARELIVSDGKPAPAGPEPELL